VSGPRCDRDNLAALTIMNQTIFGLTALVGFALFACAQNSQGKCDRTTELGYEGTPAIPGQQWGVHDIKRPHPPVVTPGAQILPVPPPSDAVVLFDGKDLSKWSQRGRGPNRGTTGEPGWRVENGYMEVVGGTGDIVTKDKFGDAQYHIEWATPAQPCGSGQWRANSGIMIMGRYEIQVLDSFENPTYADGQAASIYGQYPPLVNASRKPGEWQSYDIIFEAPRFDGDKLVRPPYVSMFHNGVLVHHRRQVTGPVGHKVVVPFKPHGDEEPLVLQDHDAVVHFRNIWVRRLAPNDQKQP
jgi:hypothetical protein